MDSDDLLHRAGTVSNADSVIPDLSPEMHELLDQWQELLHQGKSVPLEDFCRDKPELLVEFRSCIEALQSFSRFDKAMNAENQPIPEQIGDYQVLSELARGGTSTNYLVEQKFPKRSLALKLFDVRFDQESSASRFRLEVHLLATLVHPNISKIYSAGVAKIEGRERPYFTMEWIDGLSIVDHVKSKSESEAWTHKETLKLCLPFLDAIAFAHANGVVHRDIKPGNLMVTDRGVPKVIDFGIARVTTEKRDDFSTYPTSKAWAGTLPYMSPEQFGLGESALDTRSDIYSMAVVVFQLLTGQLPYHFQGESTWKVAEVICSVNPIPVE